MQRHALSSLRSAPSPVCAGPEPAWWVCDVPNAVTQGGTTATWQGQVVRSQPSAVSETAPLLAPAPRACMCGCTAADACAKSDYEGCGGGV